MNKNKVAFSIVETMIVLLVISVLVIFGVPQYTEYMVERQASHLAATLAEGLRTARTVAIQEADTVSICSIVPAGQATDACQVVNVYWDHWKIHRSDGSTIKIFKWEPDAYGNIRRTVAANIAFSPMGVPNFTGSNEVFDVRPNNAPSGLRCKRVEVTASGSVFISELSC